MRSVLAFVLGIFVTVGGAYFHDKYDSDAGNKQLVNWTQLADSAHAAVGSAREQWDRLTAK